MNSNIFQDIKDRVDLKDLVRYYGLEVDRGGFACCPFHNERHPSFKVYEDHYHCFGCGEHGDHIDFVQKLYGLTNIEAAKKISHDFGLGLFEMELATPIKPNLKEKSDFQKWLFEAKHTLSEYIELLEKWEKIYSPRSPVDPVSERYLESIHQKQYAKMLLDELTFGDKQEKQNIFITQRDYVQKIKKRLDKLDAISRKPYKRII